MGATIPCSFFPSPPPLYPIFSSSFRPMPLVCFSNAPTFPGSESFLLPDTIRLFFSICDFTLSLSLLSAPSLILFPKAVGKNKSSPSSSPSTLEPFSLNPLGFLSELEELNPRPEPDVLEPKPRPVWSSSTLSVSPSLEILSISWLGMTVPVDTKLTGLVRSGFLDKSRSLRRFLDENPSPSESESDPVANTP
uniref:Uncharacterized protein n=1 Tax=Cucumis sativus TaxID=3659 RepID=A0A0A0LTJ4_CUCSA